MMETLWVKEEVLKVVEESMASSCNFYAKEDMGKAMAVDDAWRVLDATLKNKFKYLSKFK